MKHKEELETKELKLLFPFVVKAEESTEGIVVIEGWANYAGNMDDDKSVFIDHSSEIIDPKGIDLSYFRKNPVILWQHDRKKVIGKAVEIIKKKEGIWIKAEVHLPTMEPEDAYAVVNQLVRQFSVGVRYHKVECRTIKDKEVYVATKSTIMEVSIVTIAANSASEWTIVKSFGEDGFGSEDLNFSNEVENKSQDQESKEEIEFMKIKVAEKFSADEISKMVQLGIVSSADAEVEIGIKEYIDLTVSEKFAAFKVELKDAQDAIQTAKEAEELAVKEAKEAEEMKAQVELAEKLSISVDELKGLSAEEIEVKVKALEGPPEDQLSDDELKALEDFLKDEAVTSLKSLIEE